MSYDLACLSPAGIAIPFEPGPYSYDSSTVDDPSSLRLFVQLMREQEDRYFAIFPAAKKAAEYRKRREEAYLTTLHSLGHRSESAQLNHQSYQAAYHTSLSDYYLGQQPLDIVSGAIPETPLSYLSLSIPPPEADACDDLSKSTLVIPDLCYQRQDNELTPAVNFHQHSHHEEYKPKEDNHPSIGSRHKLQPVSPYNHPSRSRTLSYYRGQSHPKGPGPGHCLKRRKNTQKSPPTAGKLHQVNRKVHSFFHGRKIACDGSLPSSVDQYQLEALSMQIASIHVSS